jgi:hypothetical protein
MFIVVGFVLMAYLLGAIVAMGWYVVNRKRKRLERD